MAVDIQKRLGQWKTEATDPAHPNYPHANLDEAAEVYERISTLLTKLRENTDAFSREDIVALFDSLNSGKRMKNKVADENQLPELREALLELIDSKGNSADKITAASQVIKFAGNNTLGELYGWANIENAPLYNACSIDALQHLGYSFGSKNYDEFIAAHEKFKVEYASKIGHLRPSLPLNLEIDKLYNVIDKVDLKPITHPPKLAAPFNEIFANWDEAERGFDLLTEAARHLGISGPGDEMAVFNLRKTEGLFRIRFSYGQWLVMGLAGRDGHLIELELALFKDQVNVQSNWTSEFRQPEEEKAISIVAVPADTFRISEDQLSKLHGLTLAHIKEKFSDWHKSNLRIYNKGPIAEAIFNKAARDRILSDGLIVFDEPPSKALFSPKAFELLKDLHDTPTKEYYQAHKVEFKTEVEKPFQTLVHAVASQLPPKVQELMETERQVFSRFIKNDYGQGGAWDFFWGAFYPKGGKRTQDAQLLVMINYQRLEYGFFIADYGHEPRKRFCHHSEKYLQDIERLLGGILSRNELIFGDRDQFVFGSDGELLNKPDLEWKDFLRNPSKSSNNVKVVLSKVEILKIPADELAERIAETFKLLFPLVLLAVSDNPLPEIGEYLTTIGKPRPPQPEYPLIQCAAETGFTEKDLASWVRAIHRKGQAIIYGPPGTGKTYIAERLARHLIGGGDGFTDLVQFHPAYAYEDFVQGIRPQSASNGGLKYPMLPGRFLDFCDKSSKCQGNCILIIDEINRANLARVFGELMYLLEYRDAKVPLAGGGTLRIPQNVRIIGTMNTADRSIALVDHALRRRFAFLELRPNYDVLTQYHVRKGTGFPVDGLIQTLKRLNNTISDRHYEVGITFFLHPDLVTQIEDIWQMEIQPYLDEYFFDQPDKAKGFYWEFVRQDLKP